MKQRKPGSHGLCLVFSLILVWGTVNPARAQDTQESVERLQQIARQTTERVQQYLEATANQDLSPVEADIRRHLLAHRKAAEEVKNCIAEAGKALAKLDPQRFARMDTFRARFDERARSKQFEHQVDVTVDLTANCRVDRLTFSPGDRFPGCCRLLDQNELGADDLMVASRVFVLAEDLGRIWTGYEGNFGERTVKKTQEVLSLFERKLLDGFPATPWEYMLNFQGGRDGPSPHQLIWLHPNLGLEVDPKGVGEGQNRLQPVLVLQALGYNRYLLHTKEGFGRKLNYIGFAGILTFNSTKGLDAVRYGGLVHLGNYLSVGTTFGDSEWRLYLSSDKVFDQVVRLLQ